MLRAENIIKAPIITEKSSEEIGFGKYTFKVDKRANKIEIAKAIEKLFNVKVVSVNTINYDGKLKRQGKTQGRRPSFKKAIVQIDQNPQSIKYLTEGGKEKIVDKKYNTEIEGFLGL